MTLKHSTKTIILHFDRYIRRSSQSVYAILCLIEWVEIRGIVIVGIVRMFLDFPKIERHESEPARISYKSIDGVYE